MENALRYGRDGGHLEVALHYASGHYILEFTDDGPGVSPQFLPEMFKRFSREEQSRARHSGGSGLGLSIARAICRRMGVRLARHYRNRRPRGAHFVALAPSDNENSLLIKP
jgi:signal transduction histidine kinase